VKSRGYSGGPDHFRHLIALHRPRPKAEAYLRLRTLPGEQAQVDWGLCRARHSPHYAELWTMPSSKTPLR
jgi:transposase